MHYICAGLCVLFFIMCLYSCMCICFYVVVHAYTSVRTWMWWSVLWRKTWKEFIISQRRASSLLHCCCLIFSYKISKSCPLFKKNANDLVHTENAHNIRNCVIRITTLNMHKFSVTQKLIVNCINLVCCQQSRSLNNFSSYIIRDCFI